MTKTIFLPHWVWLVFIMVLGGVLRFCSLGSLPNGFHNDEVMNGYVGRFTIQNGVDLYGNKLPFLYFDNFGDYPNILPMYLSGLSTYVFGVNSFAVRFPIALAGTLSIGVLYAVARVLFPSGKAPLFSALLLALLPWHIVLSRATAEGVTACLVFLIALWLLFVSIKQLSWWRLGVSYLLLAATYFLYPSFRVLVPLMLLPTFLLAKKKRWAGALAVGAGIFLILTLLISNTRWGKGRFDQTSVFTFNNVLQTRITQGIYGDTHLPIVVTRLFHNRYFVGAREIIHQYLHYVSGEFLFTRNGWFCFLALYR
jgi:4-amino-4-deoxy-L-arabinose transferase-like glycosyltransferase